jgi:outer membrane biosynthesis protein TonB
MLALKPKLTDISKIDKPDNKQKDTATEKEQKKQEQKEKEQKEKEQKQKEHKKKDVKDNKQKSPVKKSEKPSSSDSEPEQTDSNLDIDKSDDFYDNLKKNLDTSINYSKKFNIDDEMG